MYLRKYFYTFSKFTNDSSSIKAYLVVNHSVPQLGKLNWKYNSAEVAQIANIFSLLPLLHCHQLDFLRKNILNGRQVL